MNTININNNEKPHFVLVPLMAQGHMIPMVDIARLLADRGAQVSFITTPVNAARIKPVFSHMKSENRVIKIVELAFPCKKFGLPEGCENFDLVSSKDHFKPFFEAISTLGEQLQNYILHNRLNVSCIISDYCNWFTAEVGQCLNIPRIIFHGPSCFFIHSIYSICKHKAYDGVGEFEPVIVPDLPKKVEITKAQAPVWFGQWEDYLVKAEEAEASARGILINTFYELESEIVDRYKKLIGKMVWPIGPLCLYDRDTTSKAKRGKKSSIDESQVVNWLDTKRPKSVIYVSFGSIIRTRTSQLIEIGTGLESSNQPFIWVIKEVEKTPEFDKWMSEGFEERTKERGLIITGWAPQTVILSHPSVGGFMTHCGWNSTLEAISAGVPMMTWPHLADQFLNEKLIVEIIEIGVAVGVTKPYNHVQPDEAPPVRGEDVEKAVIRLLDEGEEGKEMRKRVAEFREKAQKAMEEGGSSYRNSTLFMEYIIEGAK